MGKLLTLLVFCVVAAQLPAQAVRDRHVEAELVAEASGAAPGGSIWIALKLKHDPHWHTYWKSSTTGFPPSIEWDLPTGFTVGDFQWPVPSVYGSPPVVDYVIEETALLPMRLTVPPGAVPGDEVTLGAQVDWLMCADVCIPGGVQLALRLQVLPPGESPAPTAWAGAIRGALEAMPVAVDSWAASALRREQEIVLEVRPGPGAADRSGPFYLFNDQGLIVAETSQRQEALPGGGVRLFLPVEAAAETEAGRLTGVLTDSDTWGGGAAMGLLIDATLVDVAQAEAVTATATTAPEPAGEGSSAGGGPGLAAILFAAVLGGLILNLMPCVFPVLGIKIMGFVGQAGMGRRKVIGHGLAYTAGILVSFWVLVGVLLLLRGAGHNVGWGYQLQYPGFNFALAVVLLLFGLNMSGVFEVGGSLVGAGSKVQGSGGLRGAFLGGVLATVVATPCSAPFLATAIGFAFIQPPVTTFLIFTCVGIGLALPYLFFSAFPSLVRVLPRPGAWMETFKQGLAFLLYGTVAYLAWLISQQVTGGGHSDFAFLRVLFGLVLAALAAWVYGRWTPIYRARTVRLAGTGAALAVLAGAFLMGLPGQPDPVAAQRLVASANTAGTATRPAVLPGEDKPTFLPWQPGLPEELAAQGHVVWVDFTAKWCATCQTNKWVVFSSDAVIDAFRDGEVIALKADWTNADPRITEELARWDRAAVPFNLVYAPGKAPVTLPATLTPGLVLDALAAGAK